MLGRGEEWTIDSVAVEEERIASRKKNPLNGYSDVGGETQGGPLITRCVD